MNILETAFIPGNLDNEDLKGINQHLLELELNEKIFNLFTTNIFKKKFKVNLKILEILLTNNKYSGEILFIKQLVIHT